MYRVIGDVVRQIAIRKVSKKKKNKRNFFVSYETFKDREKICEREKKNRVHAKGAL